MNDLFDLMFEFNSLYIIIILDSDEVFNMELFLLRIIGLILYSLHGRLCHNCLIRLLAVKCSFISFLPFYFIIIEINNFFVDLFYCMLLFIMM